MIVLIMLWFIIFRLNRECSKINNPFLTADIYDKLGTVYSALDSLNIAEQYFSEAEKIAGENQAAYTALLAAVNRAEVLVKKEEYTKALVLLNSVTNRSSSGDFSYIQARAENLRGNILEKRNDFEGALSAYNRTLEIVKNLNEKTLEVEAYFNLAKLNDSRNLYDSSRKLLPPGMCFNRGCLPSIIQSGRCSDFIFFGKP